MSHCRDRPTTNSLVLAVPPRFMTLLKLSWYLVLNSSCETPSRRIHRVVSKSRCGREGGKAIAKIPHCEALESYSTHGRTGLILKSSSAFSPGINENTAVRDKSVDKTTSGAVENVWLVRYSVALSNNRAQGNLPQHGVLFTLHHGIRQGTPGWRSK